MNLYEPPLASALIVSIHPTQRITNDAQQCDSLILKDGGVLLVKIKEIGLKDIRYKLCDFEEGPDYLVEKTRVASIHYANGKQETFNEAAPINAQKNKASATPPNSKKTENNTMAALSLSFGILGIYPLIFIGSILGIIFGVIAMNEIKSEPGRYKNETMAKVGMALSFTGLIFWMAIIVLVLLM